MNNNEEKLPKVNINWYPGHMAKTKKQIIQDLKLVDIVIELIDARIPKSSQNPSIAEITKSKKKIIVLNKSDLSDDKQNKMWIKYFGSKNTPAVLVDSNSGRGIEDCIKKIEEIMQVELNQHAEKGRTGRRIRAMIVGIPNVGKSSFINRISKRTTAEVGNKPGVTKQKQWIRINEKIELLDTPGVLWPKFESEEVALNLCYTGTIKEEILDKLEIAYQLTKFLLENYRTKLCERYKLEEKFIEEKLAQDQPENNNIYEIMLEMGKNRGCIMSGGRIDEEKTARLILEEFKNGKLGKITIEMSH
ncbi:MAG: ribosome biogenesis GTPase YlqF [Clostridia bacterium]|jgi:ribosome biogenesis GTPase A|nr:ribosome biogenesis GTPase YlqF [Clostridia bacterium]